MERVRPSLTGVSTRELLAEILRRAEIEAAVGFYQILSDEVAIGAKSLLDSLPGSILDNTGGQ